MPKPESSNSNQEPSCETPRFRPNWPAAAAGLAVGLWLLAAMVSYLPLQKGIFSTGTTTDQAHVPKNWMGLVGVDCARLAFIWFGLAGWLLPVFGLWAFWLALWNARRLVLTRLVAMLAALASAAALTASLNLGNGDWYPPPQGIERLCRLVGSTMSCWIRRWEDSAASPCSSWFMRSRSFSFSPATSRRSWTTCCTPSTRGGNAEKAGPRSSPRRDASPRARPRLIPAAMPPPVRKPEPAIPAQGLFPSVPAFKPTADPAEKPETKPDPKPWAKPEVLAPVPVPKPAIPLPGSPTGKVELNIVKPAEPKKARLTVPQSKDQDYQFPPLALLKEQVLPATESAEEFTRNMADLVRILGEFDVEVTPGNIQLGPVITCYELVPAAGVRVEKISGLDKNIALGMRAQSVRILAPIPGQGGGGRRGAQPPSHRGRVCAKSSRARIGPGPRPSCPSRSARMSRASRSSPISPRCPIC